MNIKTFSGDGKSFFSHCHSTRHYFGCRLGFLRILFATLRHCFSSRGDFWGHYPTLFATTWGDFLGHYKRISGTLSDTIRQGADAIVMFMTTLSNTVHHSSVVGGIFGDTIRQARGPRVATISGFWDLFVTFSGFSGHYLPPRSIRQLCRDLGGTASRHFFRDFWGTVHHNSQIFGPLLATVTPQLQEFGGLCSPLFRDFPKLRSFSGLLTYFGSFRPLRPPSGFKGPRFWDFRAPGRHYFFSLSSAHYFMHYSPLLRHFGTFGPLFTNVGI